MRVMLHAVSTQLAAMARQSQQARRELCGFLLGKRDGNILVAAAFAEIQNISPWPDGFMLHDSHTQRLFEQAVERQLEVLAFVHTHLSASVDLSIADCRAIARDSLPWIVLSWNGRLIVAAYSAGSAEPMPVRLSS